MLLARYDKPDPDKEKVLREYYATRSARDRANSVYDKLKALEADKKTALERGEVFEPDADLIREIKVLSEDDTTRDLGSKTFTTARTEGKQYVRSAIGKEWHELNQHIERLEKEFIQVERDIFLKRLKTRSAVSSTESKATRLTKELLELKSKRDKLKSLSDRVHTPENTDAAAAFQFETLVRYADQLKKGFVWLPTREKIHAETVAALQNGRWPVLIGEAGTGKSDQADAAAFELTGYLPTEIQCEKSTDKTALIADRGIDAATGGDYFIYGPMMSAYTGFEDSRQSKPACATGRIVRFDEAGYLGEKAYGILKGARQKQVGDDFYGHPVLPGATSIWTTNPVGPRYPGRHEVDPAMRREIANIHVDYPDQSADNPETYEFMLTALLDQNHHIEVAKEELAPAYEKQELADEEKKPLQDGRIPMAKDVLIEDTTDTKHGALWRLANAVKTLQNAFIYGNTKPEMIPADALRFTEDDKGNITLGGTGGEVLTLSTTTITFGELKSWMSGFSNRLQKQNEAYQVDTFSAWIALKLKTYLKQVDVADREKIKAIFETHHLFDHTNDLTNAPPITPKEIGYLSPRVPRPLHLKLPEPPPKDPEAPPSAKEAPPSLEALPVTTKQVIIEGGATVTIIEGRYLDTTLHAEEGDETGVINLGRRFRIKDNDYTFAGIVEQKDCLDNGKLVGKPANGEEIYNVFTPEQVDRGVFVSDTDSLIEDINGSIKDAMQTHWEKICKNNSTNNPDELVMPV